MSKKLTRDLCFNFFYHLLNVVFPILAFPYVARTLSVDGFGAASLALTTATYFTTIASLGIPIYGVREVAKNKSIKTSLDRVVSELLIINAAGVLVASLLFLIAMFFVDPMRQNSTIFIIALINVVFSFFQVDWLFQGTNKFKVLAIRGLASKLLALSMIYGLVNEEGDSAYFVIANVVALSFANVLNVFFARKLIKLTFVDLDIRRHINAVIKFTATRVASSVYTLLDAVMLSTFAGMYYVGLYVIAVKLVRLVISLINSATNVFFSRLSAMKHDGEAYQESLSVIHGGLMICTLPIVLGLYLYGAEIIYLFAGGDYSESVPVIKILSFLVFFSIITSFIGVQVLYVNGEESVVATSLFVGAMVCISLNFLLVPSLKHIGAAVATLVAEFSVFIYQLQQCRRKGYQLGFFYDENSKKVYKTFFFYFITSLMAREVVGLVDSDYVRLALGVLSSIIIWAAMLFAARERIVFNLVSKYI